MVVFFVWIHRIFLPRTSFSTNSTTAPPKPSAQTQFILDAMESFSQREDSHWDQMTESIDLLFSRVGNIERVQSQMSAQIDLSAQIMDQVLRDQITLAKQLETTGQTVSRLTQRFPTTDSGPTRPPFQSSMNASGSGEPPFPHSSPGYHGSGRDSSALPRHSVPKMAFPRFTGENPRIWKDKCLDYFHIFNIPESMWVTSASMNMDANAAKWLQVYKLKHGLGTWSEFMAAVEDQFGSYTYRDSISNLIALEQEGSLDEYISAFTDLQYQVSMHSTGLDEVFFVTHFIKGLKSEVRVTVQSMAPKTAKKAIMLAKIQSQLGEERKFRPPKFSTSSRSSVITTKSDTRSSASSTSPLWKERQLRDFRKANGLCMYCGDKYDKAHAAPCAKRPQQQLNALAINDLDQTLSEEVLTQLAVEDSLQEQFEHLSLNALAGTSQGEVLQLRALVQNKVLLMLLDSGSSHSFINQSFVQLLNIPTVSSPSRAIKLPNGQILYTDKVVPALEWWCQGHTITTEMQVLDLGAYDAILGFDWLSVHSPITHHWDNKTMSFEHKGEPITIQGVQARNRSLEELPVDRLQK